MYFSIWRTLAGAVLISLAAAAGAQGGPPLVTDDPDTPGDGRWEINLATIASRTPGHWDVAAPDADINYGLGEHMQLKADIPWSFARDDGSSWISGRGASNLGVKWRFLDAEDCGYSVSTYPQYLSNWPAALARRGLGVARNQFLLPVEASTTIGTFTVDAEVGRNFVLGAAGQWIAGAILAHPCGRDVECLLEMRETLAPDSAQLLVNTGIHWKISESETVLAAIGHEAGRYGSDPQHLLFYLGVQLQR